jgi:hypothetical protein
MVTRDKLHRTVKLELDDGRATTVEAAEALAATYVLQIHVGRDVAASPTRQATLLTAVNAGARAFLGGVHVAGELDWNATGGWAMGRNASDVVTSLGGRVAHTLTDQHATLVIGSSDTSPPGSVTIHPTWNGWAAAATSSAAGRLPETAEHPVAGVLAGALAVSEAFQHTRGSLAAGRRDVGLSLWELTADWRCERAAGPELRYLPTRLWLPGLGHLGQAYLWVIGFLPYHDPGSVTLVLQDFDRVVEANRATGLLVHTDVAEGVLKTRLAAAAMEQLGFETRLIERPFDDGTRPAQGEPTWALAGFDTAEPRRHIGVFDLAVDLGLGSDRDDYLGIHLHTFPAAGNPRDTFAMGPAGTEAPTLAAWAVDAVEDACGVVQLQGAAVGAAFVGAAAAALGVAEILRALAGGPVTSVAAWALNAPGDIDAVGSDRDPPVNPGYQTAA